jgi:hypothetical protein
MAPGGATSRHLRSRPAGSRASAIQRDRVLDRYVARPGLWDPRLVRGPRRIGLCCHALHSRAGQWLINEKGAVAAAGLLGGAPPAFAERAHALLGELGTTSERLTRAIDHAAGLIAETMRGM